MMLAAHGAAAALSSAAPTPPTSTALVNQLVATSSSLPLAVTLTLFTVLPLAFMTLTAFVKISTVLHIAKNAIGIQGLPSTAIVLALSIALTLIAMSPVSTKIAGNLELALQRAGPLPLNTAAAMLDAVREPMRDFLSRNSSERELSRFIELQRSVAKQTTPEPTRATDFSTLIPAFLVSELGRAFALGFAIFLPFLILDLIVGNVLVALGLSGLSVGQVSLPFKLLLFVAADGWGLLAQTLVAGYQF